VAYFEYNPNSKRSSRNTRTIDSACHSQQALHLVRGSPSLILRLKPPASYQGSSPGTPSLVTLAIFVYGDGTVQIRSKRSLGYWASAAGTPRACAMRSSCPCSQQMSTFPGPGKAVAAAAASETSSREMELLGVRPRSAARGVTVSRGREREPSV
jgi:hypothetical protein